MAFYETLARISTDPIVGLLQLAGKDTSTNKLTAIIGSAADDAGNLIIPESVTETAKELAAKGINMEYAPSTGLAGLAELMSLEFIGQKTCDELFNNGVHRAEIVTSAGTNAIATTLLACTNHDDEIITHNPHWAGYDSIVLGIDRKPLVNFDILDKDDNFNFADFDASIKQIISRNPKTKITILLNTPYDNPLGKDFGNAVWDRLAEILAKYSNNEILLVIDTAYIDFGPSGKDYRRLNFLPSLFQKINNPNFNVVIAATVSKSFAMYGARVGVATLLTTNKQNADNWRDIAGGCIRGTFSNASRFGQEIALEILKNPAKLACVHQFQEDTSKLITKRREVLLDLISAKLPEEFKLIKPDSGFFVSLKVSTHKYHDTTYANALYEKVLASQLYVPMISSQFLRIPVCGLNESKLTQVIERLAQVAHSMTATIK
jgi:aromatic-amino-acid transaminase